MAARTPDLRLIVVTDSALAAPHSISDIVAAALDAGAPAIQLRDKRATAREIVAQAHVLLPAIRSAGALLFINDRLDVALAIGADGVHLGPVDLTVEAARRITPPDFLIGYSTDDADEARRAERHGASYIGCGAVFGTTTKQEVGNERIGTARLHEVACAVHIPVVGIGGITPENVQEVRATAAAGVAVVGAVMRAVEVGDVVRRLLR
jgi:thiamine-phosphate pyrophosphorylase